MPTLHAHRAIYRERELLTAEGKSIKKNKDEILALLEVIWLPKQAAVKHCQGHQRGDSLVIRGNNFADKTAKQKVRSPSQPPS